MNFRVHLVSTQSDDVVRDALAALPKCAFVVHANTYIENVPRAPGTAFVSPANSLGFMDGGVDMTLSRVMFPGVESRVKAAIKRRGRMCDHGPFLVVGEALSVPTGTEDGVWLISAPTMLLPCEVRGTKNAYRAMYAALREAQRISNLTDVYTTAMCTGVGRMDLAEAIGQMQDAYDDVAAGRESRYGSDWKDAVRDQPNVYQRYIFGGKEI